MPQADVIDTIIGKGLAIRNRRPVTVAQSQESYDALFTLEGEQQFSLAERFAVALFVAGLHQHTGSIAFYEEKLNAIAPNLAKEIREATEYARTDGPYGHYPDGPLSVENLDGLSWSIDTEHGEELGEKLSAALVHTHLLVFHPRDSKASHLQKLIKAGWDETTIVTLSQLVSFLCFQIRLAIGLQQLDAAG